MINKSKVRQTALNLIYAVEANGGDINNFDLNLFWDIAQEKEMDTYRKTLAKALIHTARASADSARLLSTRAEALLSATKDNLPAAKLAEDTDRLQKRSDEFEASLKALKYCLKDKRQDTTEQLGICCRELMNLAHVIQALASELVPLFADFPEYRQILQQLESAINRRNKLMAVCASLRYPQELLGQAEFTNLVRCAEMLQELRPEVEKLALAVIARRADFEEKINSLLRNYSLERMDVVDKCIIFLALYELEISKLDTPIVVSEATALAHAYSGGKSAPFIHGIISAAAKS